MSGGFVYVYFIRTETKPSLVKIGKSSNVEERLAQLQTGSFAKLHLCYKIPCHSDKQAFEVEKALHEMFKELRVNGEWFSYTGPLKSMTQGCQEKNKHKILRSLEKHKAKVIKGVYRNVAKKGRDALKDATPEPRHKPGRWTLSDGTTVNRKIITDLACRYLGKQRLRRTVIMNYAKRRDMESTWQWNLLLIADHAMEAGFKPKTSKELKQEYEEKLNENRLNIERDDNLDGEPS